MPGHIDSTHRIVIDAPVDRCLMFFTPHGETFWVDGWLPEYRAPWGARTQAGQVFTTGEGEALTIWMVCDFDRGAHRARYARVTPGSRTGFVEVCCTALEPGRTQVAVRYTLTALSEEGAQALSAFEGEAFARMIDGWAREIHARLPQLLSARID